MPTDPKHAALSEGLDDLLLDVLTNGQTIVNNDGEAVKVTPSAAMLNVISNRLKHLGITKEVNAGSSAARLASAMKERGLKFGDRPPPVSQEESEAA